MPQLGKNAETSARCRTCSTPPPSGPLGIALGAETRWEQATNPAVPFTDIGDIVGLGYSQFDSKRRVFAMFGEVTAPVTKWLELSGALRYLANSYGTNYNQAWHQAGAVGRFFTVGAKYTF